MAMDTTTTTSSIGEELRGGIGNKILKYGCWILGTLGVLVFAFAIIMLCEANAIVDLKEAALQQDKAISLITNIFHALLPVIATWVGTVIAFYFGTANFEAANKSVQALVTQITNSDDKLKATKVSDADVMRFLQNINYNKTISAKADTDIKVQADLLDFLDNPDNKGDRLPIFDDKNVIRYIIHESTLNEFARKFTAKAYTEISGEKTLADVTLDEMVNKTDPDMKSKLTNSTVFVAKNASLYEAKIKMKSNTTCQDVFVTENGIATEPIIGWITNNKIADISKI
jgi:hypothetical protein